jgi:hypothetical protein
MIVMFRKEGQLGNRLFNFANFIAFAEAECLTLANPSFSEYALLFSTTRHDLLCRYPPRRSILSRIGALRVREALYSIVNFIARAMKKLKLDSRLVRVISIDDNSFYVLDDNPLARLPFNGSRLVFVGGLQFRNLAAMKTHRQTICAYFRPLPVHQEKIYQAIDIARKNCDVLVGVHIRGGDYASHLGGRYCYTVPDYIHVMRCVSTLFPGKRVVFLICSNSILDPEMFEEMNCHFGPNHHLQDMYAFAECDYIIGPPSTYTLWASFYGNVPLYFIQEPNKPVTLDMFKDYFSQVGQHAVQKDIRGEQFVVINGVRYGLHFPTDKDRLAL